MLPTRSGALGEQAKQNPSVTATIGLVGADGYHAIAANRARYAERYGWDEDRITHLLERYGAQIEDLGALIDADPSLGAPLAKAPQFLRADVVFAVRYEGYLKIYFGGVAGLMFYNMGSGVLRAVGD